MFLPQDIRAAIDDMHVTSLKLKTTILANPAQYIRSDPRLECLLRRLGSDGQTKVFLLTNRYFKL